MRNLALILVALSVVSVVLAVVFAVTGTAVAGVNAEGFSRGCSNLALLGIALMMASDKKGA